MSARRLALVTTAGLATLGACQSDRAPAAGGPPPSVATRLLPAAPALAVHVDVARARTWPLFARAVALALPDAEPQLARVKEVCGLDVVAALTDLVIVRGGTAGGDLGLVARGLPRAKVLACVTALAAPGGPVTATVDGDLVHVGMGGAPILSAALLPNDELVVVTRDGKGVDPATWQAEVARPGPAPAWARALPGAPPVAVRVATPERTVVAGVTLGDPLVVRGTLTAPSPEAATGDLARGKAIASFLGQARAGTATVTARGATVEGELTARGPEVEAFVTTVLPTLLGGGATAPTAPAAPTVVLDPSAPAPTCAELGPAAERYLDATLARMDAGRRAAMEPSMTALRPKLAAAYVDSCTQGAWPAAAIACHVTYATQLQRFERCRLLLEEAPRKAFDAAVTAALGM